MKEVWEDIKDYERIYKISNKAASNIYQLKREEFERALL